MHNSKLFIIFALQMINKYKMKRITDIEGLCNAVGCNIENEMTAQQRIESILNYLQETGVIKEYNADRLDRVFSDEEVY